MAKTKQELADLKFEYEKLSEKLRELTDEELETVIGGAAHMFVGLDFDHGEDHKDDFFQCICGENFYSYRSYQSHLRSCPEANGKRR